MRKGLLNLAAVAVALLGFNATAMAPVISDLPSPIIGDAVGATGDNTFVYPDAFSLDGYVSDDYTADSGIIWTYETASGSKYAINGVDELGSDDPNNPAAAKQLTANDNDTEAVDSDAQTITLRDIELSPAGGAPYADPAGGPGIVNTDVVTFHASDGGSVSTKSTIFYTDDEGQDRFSQAGEIVIDLTFGTTTTGWSFSDFGTGLTESRANGLCTTVPVAGDETFAQWFSSDGSGASTSLYDLTANSVYQHRVGVTTDAAVGAANIFQIVANNTDNAFGAEFFGWDKEGGANHPGAVSKFEFWAGPANMGLSGWNASGGAFDAANDAKNDVGMQMTIFDTNNVEAGTRGGTHCFTDLQILRHNPGGALVDSTVFSDSNFTAANWVGAGILGNIVLNFTGGVMEFVATDSDVEFITADPGDSTNTSGNDADNAPVPWDTANQLYRIEWSISAGAGNPPDVIRLEADSNQTQEIITNGYVSVLSFGDTGMPSTAEETWQMYFYSHNVSATTVFTKGFRPRLTLANRAGSGGDFDADNQTATIKAHSVTVDKVSF
jgi:hypothetical protein